MNFNEILGKILEKENSVEMADLLNDLKSAYETDTADNKGAEWEQKYHDLEKRYVDTFRATLDKPADNAPPQPQKEEKPNVPETSIDDLATEIE